MKKKTKQRSPPPTMQDGPVKGPGSLHRWHWDPKKQLHSLYLNPPPHIMKKNMQLDGLMSWCSLMFSGFQSTKKNFDPPKDFVTSCLVVPMPFA